MKDLSRYNPQGSTLRKTQLRMLDILIEVDKICRKHKIDYFLDSGTLLGAVRHGGFIPWDDDLDIAIRREDWHKLRIALQNELPANMCYHDWTNDSNYHLSIAKVRDVNSIFEDPGCRNMRKRGIFVDIFFVEPSIPLKLRKPIDFVYIRCLRGIHNYSDSFIEKLLGYLCYPMTYFVVWACRCWAKITHTRMVGRQYGWISALYIDHDKIFPVKEIQFENHLFYAPNDTDSFLSTLYGDYMQIPPEDKRETHLAKITFLDEQ